MAVGPGGDVPDIPVDQLTNRQYLHLIYEGITAMAQEIEDLKAVLGG
jgi:hypothetical protein